MLGLGTSVTSIDSGQIYQELSELSNYTDLAIHFDFSTLSGDHGSEVTAAGNLGGAGASSNISSNSGTPLLDRNKLGGRASVAFDGNDDILIIDRPFPSTAKDFTFFIVMQRADVSNDYAIAGSSDGVTDYIRFTASGGSIQTVMEEKDAVTTTTSNTNGSTVDYTQVADVPTVLVFRRAEEGELYIYADNGLYIAAKTNEAMLAAAKFTIQAIGGTTSGSLSDFTGNIGEVGMYDADIGEESAIILSKELSTKWGVNRTS